MSREVSRTHVVMIRQSLLESAVSDAVSVASSIIMIGIGVFLDSPALQWLGAILAFVLIVARSANSRFIHRITIPEARVLLDKIEAGQ